MGTGARSGRAWMPGGVETFACKPGEQMRGWLWLLFRREHRLFSTSVIHYCIFGEHLLTDISLSRFFGMHQLSESSLSHPRPLGNDQTCQVDLTIPPDMPITRSFSTKWVHPM